MKIALLVDSLAVGGAERQAILCVSELRKLGHSVDLVHYRPKVEYHEMLACLQIDPIYIAAAGFGQRCHRLRALFRDRAYDVVHGFKMAAEIYAAIAGTWARVPRLFGSCRSVYEPKFKLCLIHSLIDKLLDGWIVNSRVGAESMARHTRIPARKISILRNALCREMFARTPAVAHAKSRLGLPEDAIVITLIARLDAAKNHRLLIATAATIQKEVPAALFLVVGKGPLKDGLVEYASQQGVLQKVLFWGERSDVPAILAATDISVLTSDYEGLPNVILEAMAAGKPIACTGYAGYDEIMTHERNALISPCGDHEAFARNLLRLINDQPLRERLGRNAFEHAQRQFSPEGMAKRLEQIYGGGVQDLAATLVLSN